LHRNCLAVTALYVKTVQWATVLSYAHQDRTNKNVTSRAVRNTVKLKTLSLTKKTTVHLYKQKHCSFLMV